MGSLPTDSTQRMRRDSAHLRIVVRLHALHEGCHRTLVRQVMQNATGLVTNVSVSVFQQREEQQDGFRSIHIQNRTARLPADCWIVIRQPRGK